MVRRILMVAMLCIAAVVGWPGPALPVINYQGKLTDGSGISLSGSHSLTFSIYEGGTPSTPGSGTLLCTESPTLNITNGIVDYEIGSTSGTLGSVDFQSAKAYYLEVAVDSPSNVIIPRTLLGWVPLARRAAQADNADRLGNLLPTDYAGAAHNHDGVYVRVKGTAHVIIEATDNATSNGLNLLAGYVVARALTPNGQALGATNRAVVIVSPGRYDLQTTQVTLDTEFVDLVGLSTARSDQHIFGLSGGQNTGVVAQTANDVRIENLTVECAPPSGSPFLAPATPAAYFPSGAFPATVVRNCTFLQSQSSLPTRYGVEYAGSYTDCEGPGGPFFAGDCSGVFTDCTGGLDSFGGGSNHVASGKFTRCTASAFGFGADVASGRFESCTGGFGSFASNPGTGVATGTFVNCTGGQNSFAGSSGTASGVFTDCVATTGSFGSGGVATGTFRGCTGGENSFGGNNGNTTGANLVACTMTDGVWIGSFSGRMENCVWGTTISLTLPARIYGSTFNGSVLMNSLAVGVTFCRAQAFTNASANVFGATDALAFNLSNVNVSTH